MIDTRNDLKPMLEHRIRKLKILVLRSLGRSDVVERWENLERRLARVSHADLQSKRIFPE